MKEGLNRQEGVNRTTSFNTIIIIVGTGINLSSELVRRAIGSEPALNGEELLSAGDVGPSGGNLDVVTVPTVVWTRSIGGKLHVANWVAQTWASAREYVQVAPLVVLVVPAHQPTPGPEIFDEHAAARVVVECYADVCLGPPVPRLACSCVYRVYTLVLHIFNNILFLKKIKKKKKSSNN